MKSGLHVTRTFPEFPVCDHVEIPAAEPPSYRPKLPVLVLMKYI